MPTSMARIILLYQILKYLTVAKLRLPIDQSLKIPI